jgi:hypothetical protein
MEERGDARDEMEGPEGVWVSYAYLVKHSVHDVALWEESVGVEVRPQPYEDLLTRIYI